MPTQINTSKNSASLNSPTDLAYTETFPSVASYTVNSINDDLISGTLTAVVAMTDSNNVTIQRRLIVWAGADYTSQGDYTHQNVYDAIAAILGG